MASRTALPLEDITLHTVCELRDAFTAFVDYKNKKVLPKGFPQDWSASVVIAPKVDTDTNARLGLTGTSRGPNPNTFYNTWAIGSAPGAGIIVKSNKTGSVTYYVNGRDLIALPVECSGANNNSHALAQTLGIKDWFARLVDVGANENLAGAVSMKFDKTSFGAQITVKAEGAASFTYNFPFGTNFASAGGSYQVEEQLTIAFAYDPPKPAPIIQYPLYPVKPPEPSSAKPPAAGVKKLFGPNFQRPAAPRPYRLQGVSEEAKDKLDFIQNEQLLRGLRSSQ